MASPRSSERDAARDADRLIDAAEAIVAPSEPRGPALATALDSFVGQWRDWIVAHHDLPGTRTDQAERTRLLLHAMASVGTLDQAITLLARFRRMVWGDRGLRVVRSASEIVLVLEQPARTGVAGLLGDIWSLSFLLAELEFLAGGRVAGTRGAVRSTAGPRAVIVPILFDRPLVYDAPALALHLPIATAKRAIVVRGEQVEDFLAKVMPTTLGIGAAKVSFGGLVAAIVRADLRDGAASLLTLEAVAGQLGLGVATLRRRLADEGLTFRALRERVHDDLTLDWLDQGLRVETIAGRLGYSDAFAFRRAFRRRHGRSPRDYRHDARGP